MHVHGAYGFNDHQGGVLAAHRGSGGKRTKRARAAAVVLLAALSVRAARVSGSTGTAAVLPAERRTPHGGNGDGRASEPPQGKTAEVTRSFGNSYIRVCRTCLRGLM